MYEILKLLESCNYPLKSGLTYKNEFTLLVAIILSAQAQDKFINTQTEELFDKFDTAEKMLDLGEGIFDYICRIGLWRNKGKNILALCSQIADFKRIKDHKGWYNTFLDKPSVNDDLTLFGPIISKEGIPSFRLALLTLAGVGRKTANVFLNVIYQAPVFPVDTHVIRLSNKLGLVSSKNPLDIEETFFESVPNQYRDKIAHYLVWHGRKICTARAPKCQECLLKNLCPFFKANFL